MPYLISIIVLTVVIHKCRHAATGSVGRWSELKIKDVPWLSVTHNQPLGIAGSLQVLRTDSSK